jgi:hypothetical protein
LPEDAWFVGAPHELRVMFADPSDSYTILAAGMPGKPEPGGPGGGDGGDADTDEGDEEDDEE